MLDAVAIMSRRWSTIWFTVIVMRVRVVCGGFLGAPAPGRRPPWVLRVVIGLLRSLLP